MTTSGNTSAELLDAVLADLARVVGAITDDQLHDPTPCTDYDVGQLRGHVLGWLTNFAAGFADRTDKHPWRPCRSTTPPPNPQLRCGQLGGSWPRPSAVGPHLDP